MDIDKDFDIMVTDKLIRNAKMLSAISKGAKIVGLKWVTDSHKAKELIEVQDEHVLYCKDFEKKYNCNLKKLYSNLKTKKLMNGV